jgi:hypothetical protein
MTMTMLAESLKEHAFTSGLSDSQVAKLAQLAREVSFHEDEVILVVSNSSRSP